MADTQVMTVAEVAAGLGVSQPTVMRWANDGRLQIMRRSPLLFDVKDVAVVAAELAAKLTEQLEGVQRLADLKAAS